MGAINVPQTLTLAAAPGQGCLRIFIPSMVGSNTSGAKPRCARARPHRARLRPCATANPPPRPGGRRRPPTRRTTLRSAPTSLKRTGAGRHLASKQYNRDPLEAFWADPAHAGLYQFGLRYPGKASTAPRLHERGLRARPPRGPQGKSHRPGAPIRPVGVRARPTNSWQYGRGRADRVHAVH
jgi:hypothetical protein